VQYTTATLKMCIDGLCSLIMDVSAFLTETFLTENSPNSCWTNVQQIHFCVGCNILSIFHIWKKTELHIPVNTSW